MWGYGKGEIGAPLYMCEQLNILLILRQVNVNRHCKNERTDGPNIPPHSCPMFTPIGNVQIRRSPASSFSGIIEISPNVACARSRFLVICSSPGPKKKEKGLEKVGGLVRKGRTGRGTVSAYWLHVDRRSPQLPKLSVMQHAASRTDLRVDHEEIASPETPMPIPKSNSFQIVLPCRIRIQPYILSMIYSKSTVRSDCGFDGVHKMWNVNLIRLSFDPYPRPQTNFLSRKWLLLVYVDLES